MENQYIKSQLSIIELRVPYDIKSNIYNCTLSLLDFFRYELDDKVYLSCLMAEDRKIVEKFGFVKCMFLDWELIETIEEFYNNINYRDLLLSIDSETIDINIAFYNLVKDKIKSEHYSETMKKNISNISFDYENEKKYLIDTFNTGYLPLSDIFSNWDLFKDKDLTYCLQHDSLNFSRITDDEVKQFASNYAELMPLIKNNDDIFYFIRDLNALTDENKVREYIKKITDEVLKNAFFTDENGFLIMNASLTNNEYKILFRYSSLEDYLMIINKDATTAICDELKQLPDDYIFNMSIPFREILNYSSLEFIAIYGLKNIVDFDDDNDHFFTRNNCENLKILNSLYIYGARKITDSNKTLFTKGYKDLNSDNRFYTKEEFYEAIRRMMLYGPTDFYCEKIYGNVILKLINTSGEFKKRNIDLFLNADAPIDLQQLFYQKMITPRIIKEHPEYIKYLEDKNIACCFEKKEVKVKNGTKENNVSLYSFLGSKLDFNDFISFIIEYCDVMSYLFNESSTHETDTEFLSDDSILDIYTKINSCFRKIIIEQGIPYSKELPQRFIEMYPNLFLNDAPSELTDVLYNRTIDSEFILANPDFKEYLKNVDLEVIYKYMPVDVINNDGVSQGSLNLVMILKDVFGKESFDVMLLYGKYIEKAFHENRLINFKYNPIFTKDELLNELDKTILSIIIDGKIKYDENMSEHFINNNATLFLSQKAPLDIRNKFYNRELTVKDFINNSKLYDFFDNTNIACGFPLDMSWIIPLFNDLDDFKKANYNRMKIISAYSKIQDVALQKIFKEFVMEFETNIDVEKVRYVSEVLSRLSFSNSTEIFTFRKELATQLLKTDNPLESLSKIEDVFIKNNVPIVGKIYSCFEILHPDFQNFNFEKSMISPILKRTSTTSKKIIVFSDLIKASFGSNNRSVNAYLKNIDFGSKLYESIRTGQVQLDSLTETEKQELGLFRNHLVTLYNNTMKAKKENEIFISSRDVFVDILELSKKISPDGTLDYNLADRVIRMFCGFAGIDTLEQAQAYIEKKIKIADSRNRNASNSDMVLNQGDFVKGVGNITYLRNILQNGCVSREYLGSNAGSDKTPLDTDVSMILNSNGTISEKINNTAASQYGPIWFVLKNDDRFMTTRTDSETLEIKNDMSKMEVFYTGALGLGHYGIRTGFASSEIDYIVMDNYDARVGLEIAMNGFYIPVANKDGKIVFTPKDYDELRTKMSGLSYFDEQKYSFSANLITEETDYLVQQIEQSSYEVQGKREKINDVIKKSLDELGLHLKTNIDGDLTEGFVELIDTGSTGRGTNKPGDGDFDFMMRLDKTILSNPSRLTELKQTILRNLGKENSSELTGNGDFRLKNVQIDNDTNVDIDITFTEKTDKVSYSTDMALQDRLDTIHGLDSEKYKYVVANILLAKQVLKKANVYKHNRGEIPEGGLGGVGVENWILQNGGSFVDAARGFLSAAEGKSFAEFCDAYPIWDFGENHLAERRGHYTHDNFVSNNMSENGYKKMVQALKDYLNVYDNSFTGNKIIKR